MRALSLVGFELTVADLSAAERFYTGLPGVSVVRQGWAEPAMAALLGAKSIEEIALRRGGQSIVLQHFTPAGAPYPDERRSCDQAFQHLALPVTDAVSAAAELMATPISRNGAQVLPASSGGATAYKFRDPEGHPLELIEFSDRHESGVDHSAIVSADVERSIAFYRDTLGLVVAARQTNRGPAQDRLDGLEGTVVEVVALQPATPTPHIELLAYQSPAIVPAQPHEARDIAATRLVLTVDRLAQPGVQLADGSRAALIRDPDGHLLVLIQPA